MLPSSVRRVVSTAPQSGTAAVVSSLASSCSGIIGVPRVAAAAGLSYRPPTRAHQRRYSSSKPSRTDNGAKEFSARQSPPSSSSSDQPSGGGKKGGSGSGSGSESKAAGDKRKRKAKDAASEAKPLPVVPSTQHISPEALGLSTFFSLYRPISITHSFPKTITEEKFAEIFTLRNKTSSTSPKSSDVISTLSRTVHELEHPLSKLHLEEDAGKDGSSYHDAAAAAAAADAMTRLDLRHPDGTETSVYLQLDSMAGQFLPYRPPPLPQSSEAGAVTTRRGGGSESARLSEDNSNSSSAITRAAAEEDADEADAMPRMRTYKAILTIEETVDAAGQYKVVAHSPELVEEGSLPRTFLERMALRQAQYEDARRRLADEGRNMLALSVRRQRKLKMKKKKYKKLMRRTRNERRKLQRT